MRQDRFDLKVNGKYITLDQLYDLAKEEIIAALDYMGAEDILDGSYSRYLDDEIKEILDDYEEAKEFLENPNPYRAKGEEVIERFMNCEADVTDLLQYIDKLVKDDNAWKEE